MGEGWKLTKALFRASNSLARSLGRGAQTVAAQRTNTRASRYAASGVLVPGDPDPPPSSGLDFYDYRGIAVRQEVEDLIGQPFPLGHRLDPRKGPKEEVGLPFDVLQRHAAVIGPSGSGKTKSVIIPWAATAVRMGHSAIVVDISGDLLDDLDSYRSISGPLNASVAKWDYADPRRSISWNWIGSLVTDESVVSAVDAIHGRLSPHDSQPFFHQRDARCLRGLIELARDCLPNATGRNLLDLARNESRLRGLVSAHPNHPGAGRLIDVLSSAGNYLQIMSGVINDLEIWENDGLQEITAHDGLNIAQVFEGPNLLVIGAPIYGGRISEAASGLLLSQIINQLYVRMGKDFDRQVFLFIDEAARLTGRLDYEELLSVSRHAGASVVLATQDVSQFPDADQRTSILGNCATYIALPTRSSASAEYLASRLGERYQSSTSTSQQPSGWSTVTSTTRQVGTVPVLGHREIMDPPWGERCAIIHSPPVCGKPFLVDLSLPNAA
jgi:type IV secretory pathway TraG/TraD family ATPase VirD4